ncbi:MAG: AraC family transcriptional regulator [Thermosediminibacteraceae bacterium]|nr:AraC family transcriptional regulator [Thermosediminibacteraceae bacterium]
MLGWVEGIQKAIEYIEDNLTEELNIQEIAKKAHVSPFYFQRIFSTLCGFTVGEYIRNRRLSLAAQELSESNAKIIDVAIKYGYDSPDSFTRAFTKFHGIPPSAARLKGANLKSFAPLKVKLILEGGTIMLEYKIVEKAQFTVMGKVRNFDLDTSYDEVPKFWEAHMKSGENKIIHGMFGICMDVDGKKLDYMIADIYLPWNEIPEGYETRVIPAGTWAVFPCRGPLPKSIQNVYTRIWSEWLPSCKNYKLAGNYTVEMYTPPEGNPEDYYCEIWIPVEKI